VVVSGAACTTIQTVKNLIPIALNASWGKDRHRRVPADPRHRPQPPQLLDRGRQVAHGAGRSMVPYLWSNVLTVAAPSLTRYEFDQFSGQISPIRIAVANR
jgi:hypothetical protein